MARIDRNYINIKINYEMFPQLFQQEFSTFSTGFSTGQNRKNPPKTGVFGGCSQKIPQTKQLLWRKFGLQNNILWLHNYAQWLDDVDKCSHSWLPPGEGICARWAHREGQDHPLQVRVIVNAALPAKTPQAGVPPGEKGVNIRCWQRRSAVPAAGLPPGADPLH